ncbi:MAG: hypothetical protein R3D58_14440 [Saprospiraceae bacterium]
MKFSPNTIYHIYNQGNNRQRIFFKDENYRFFLKKMREYLLPYGDLLCYCLMPNHFHWLMYVRVLEIEIHPKSGNSEGVAGSDPFDPSGRSTRDLNNAIGLLLRSYTNAINKQENRTGSLFRQTTQAKDGWEDRTLPPTHPHYNLILQNWELYGPICFNYIHNNPVKAKLVEKAEDWAYSSAPDFVGLRKGTLCQQKLAKELLFLV